MLNETSRVLLYLQTLYFTVKKRIIFCEEIHFILFICTDKKICTSTRNEEKGESAESEITKEHFTCALKARRPPQECPIREAGTL